MSGAEKYLPIEVYILTYRENIDIYEFFLGIHLEIEETFSSEAFLSMLVCKK
jgi:hypothetical protein